MHVLILYYTRTGHTLEAVQAVAQGLRSAGAEVTLTPLDAFDAESLAGHDALIVGSPCWAGSLTPNGVAMPLIRALNALPATALSGKRCGAVSVHSGVGGETTIGTLGKMLAGKGCTDWMPGPSARAGVPFSVWVGPSVSSNDEARFGEYGARFATTPTETP